MVFPRESRWSGILNTIEVRNKSIININWCFYWEHFYLFINFLTCDAGVGARSGTLRFSVHPGPVLIILSLGVVEGWRWEEGRVAKVETGRPSQHPPRTANRWDLTPSSHTSARATWVCSRDCLELVFTPTTAESGSEGDSWVLRAKTAIVDVVQRGLIKGVYKPVCLRLNTPSNWF